MVRKLWPLVAVCGLVLLTLYFTRSRNDQAGGLTPVASIGISEEDEPWRPGQVSQRPTVLQSRSSSDVSAPPIDTDYPAAAMRDEPLTADAVPQAQLRLPRDLSSSWIRPERDTVAATGDLWSGDEPRHEVARPLEAQPTDGPAALASESDATAPVAVDAQSTFPVSTPAPQAEAAAEAPPAAAPSVAAPSIAGTSTTVAPTPEFPQPIATEPPAAAATSSSAPVHIVRPGESLVDIARQHLGQGTRWMEIYRLNREQLGSQVNVLQPGMRLQLPSR